MAAETRVSLHLSKCHIVGNLMPWLIYYLLCMITGIRSQSKPQDIMHEVFRAMKTLDFVSILLSHLFLAGCDIGVQISIHLSPIYI